MSLIPDFKWAQNKEVVFVTIELIDVKDMKLSIEKSRLVFSGNVGDKKYSLDFELAKEINEKESKIAVRGRGIELVLRKAEGDNEFWGQLMKEHKKWKPHCHVDWKKWVDEDEEDKQDWNSNMDEFNPLDFQQGVFDDHEEEEEQEEE